MEPLPIDPLLPRIRSLLQEAPNLVVTAPPGSGKTTRIPPDLVTSGTVRDRLLLLQPRRVAARAAARRIASERGWKVGDRVGYQVRFDRQLTRHTTVQVLTEGILTRRLHDDPLLDGVGAVVLDEFHLRNLETDLALAYLREIQQEVRPDLRILVMSATLAADAVAAYLGGCPVLSCPDRPHPVTVHHLTRDESRDPDRALVRIVRARLAEPEGGHILVFLAGMADIRRTARALEGRVGVPVLALHGSLEPHLQDRAVAPEADRAVILATNVAETSLTIPGVDTVIDTGRVRQLHHDPTTGLEALVTTRIAADAAAQRAGRAGRTGPGRVHRLWTRAEEQGLRPTTPAEVSRVDLCRPLLELVAWGSAPDRFPWFERPPAAALEAARTTLEGIGALAPDGSIPPLGRRLLALPLHPRLALLLHRAHSLGILATGAGVAALLSEPDILPGRTDLPTGPSDLLVRLDRVEGVGDAGPGVGAVRRARDQLLRIARHVLGREEGRPATEESLGRLLLAAFPDRVVHRRRPGEPGGVMVGGRGVRLSPASVVRDAPLFLALRLDDGGRDARVHLASAVDPAWLETRERRRQAFDEDLEKVFAWTDTCYRDLVLATRSAPLDPATAGEQLLQVARRDPSRALRPGPAVEALLRRLRCLHSWRPDLDLPRIDLAALLPDACAGCTSFAALRRLDLVSRIKGKLTWEQQSALDRFVPERWQAPSGSLLRLEYRDEAPPILAVQIQHLFGLGHTPTVAVGAVKVLLHLLAPNGRPVQITDDLPSFWARTYARVRADLRGRYPKHAWPENPLEAEPESRPRRR